MLDRLTITDASSVDRYYMWQAGVDMIRDHPVFGQGPGTILARYPLYRWPEAPNTQAPHLHDNALQIAAERGIPCLGFWLWWIASAMGDAYREWRRPPSASRWAAGAALAGITAMMVAGLFEYNFGDSEVLLFILRGGGPALRIEARAPEYNRRRMRILTAARARELVRAMKGVRVLVVGDVMLDEFVWGTVSRISPEAPVPVVQVTGQSFHVGGRRQRGAERPLPRRPSGPGRRRRAGRRGGADRGGPVRGRGHGVAGTRPRTPHDRSRPGSSPITSRS